MLSFYIVVGILRSFKPTVQTNNNQIMDKTTNDCPITYMTFIVYCSDLHKIYIISPFIFDIILFSFNIWYLCYLPFFIWYIYISSPFYLWYLYYLPFIFDIKLFPSDYLYCLPFHNLYYLPFYIWYLYYLPFYIKFLYYLPFYIWYVF
jgi:hypothetical protein